MSHEFESGFVVRERAWHGLATVLATPPSVSEALRLSGLDWSVAKRPLSTTVEEDFVDENGPGRRPVEIPVPSHCAMIRESDGALLGVVSKDYVPLQNAELLSIFDPLVADGTLAIETAGSLQGGRKVWVQARYGDAIEVRDGDAIIPYLLIATGHDGRLSVYVANTPTRVVCWNTLQAAGGVDDSRADWQKAGQFRIQHRGDVRAKVEDARDVIVAANRELGVTVEAFRRMAKIPLSEIRLRELAREVFDADLIRARRELERVRGVLAERKEWKDVAVKAEVSALADELARKIAAWEPGAAESAIVESFREGPGAADAGETVWGGVNAVTHYLDHGKRGGQDRRMASSWFGEGARQRAQAFALAADLI